MTVRVDLAVLPALSVATYSMVSVAAAEVSMTMLLASAPLRKYLRPRFWSTLSVTLAPRSARESQKWIGVAGDVYTHSDY